MLTVIRSAAILIAVAGPAAAEEKPIGLSPKEAAEGWLMLFDGESTFGWTVDGVTAVKDGTLVLGGDRPTKLETAARFTGSHGYRFEFATTDGKKAKGGRIVFPGLLPGLDREEKFDGLTEGKFDGTVSSPQPGVGPVRIELPAGQRITVRTLTLRPLGLKPLFNGKDLSGWKVFRDSKREKAAFTVTAAGELHVLGGPGDLQTDATFADFVLQAEVRTNGPMVNSGLFFRCVPGQYQNGYECQIQNGFKDGDRMKPTDGGTGAIYRRQTARKVVPNDREWFTITIAAHGPHLATWVNGYPTASWTDDRKPHENPRTGLRTEAGHLSIQGHNPPMSADVLFRNIRIAEVKGK